MLHPAGPPISTATGTAGRVIGVGNEPLSIAFTP
jgi:hypothetical protein